MDVNKPSCVGMRAKTHPIDDASILKCQLKEYPKEYPKEYLEVCLRGLQPLDLHAAAAKLGIMCIQSHNTMERRALITAIQVINSVICLATPNTEIAMHPDTGDACGKSAKADYWDESAGSAKNKCQNEEIKTSGGDLNGD